MAVAVLMALLGAACGGRGGGPSTDEPTSVAPAPRAALVIQEHTQSFVDPSRPTETVGDMPAARTALSRRWSCRRRLVSPGARTR